MSRLESLNHKIRQWLLVKIAGDRTVMLNARIEMVKKNPHYGLSVEGANGGLFKNLEFKNSDGLILHISPVKKP